MDTKRILADLKAERDRIDQAIASIEVLNSTGRRRGRPPKAASYKLAPRRRRNRLSPEGRKRLSEMMKARWAARRKKAKAA